VNLVKTRIRFLYAWLRGWTITVNRYQLHNVLNGHEVVPRSWVNPE
jgi:hypothetical protein